MKMIFTSACILVLLSSFVSFVQADYFSSSLTDSFYRLPVANANDEYGFKKVAGNPWSPPAQQPGRQQQPPRQQYYVSPAQPRPEQDRFISPQELEALDNMSYPSNMWSDGAGSDSSEQHGSGWDKLDTSGLMGSSASSRAGNGAGNTYSPYSYGQNRVYQQGGYQSGNYQSGSSPSDSYQSGSYPSDDYQAGPSWNTYVPGVNQNYQPANRYYGQYATPLYPGTVDGMNSGSYINNSIAPFLY